MQDSSSIQGIKEAANEEISNFFGINIKHATLGQLEEGLSHIQDIQEILLGCGLDAPANAWTKTISAIEHEILERTLLKECSD